MSKDLSRVRELEWIANEPVRFLDDSVDMNGNKVGLTSFPRSGNSFMKKFLEQITGITTGCEIKRDITLQCAGLMGEGHSADNRVWISKSHHPIAFKRHKTDTFCDPMPVNRQIFLMRSPIDNFISLFLLL